MNTTNWAIRTLAYDNIYPTNAVLNAVKHGDAPALNVAMAVYNAKVADGARMIAPDVCTAAAIYGQNDCLKLAIRRDCTWLAETCATLAYKGNLEMIQWIRDRDYRWNKLTCSYAALGGHLDVLKWVMENGCDWDGSAYYSAVKGGHIHIVQWLLSSKYPCDKWARIKASQMNRLDIIHLLDCYDCP